MLKSLIYKTFRCFASNRLFFNRLCASFAYTVQGMLSSSTARRSPFPAGEGQEALAILFKLKFELTDKHQFIDFKF